MITALELFQLKYARVQSPDLIVLSHFLFRFGKLFRLPGPQLTLRLDIFVQRSQFISELIEVTLPPPPRAIERGEESIFQSLVQLRREILALKLLQHEVQHVEIVIAQVQSGALVAVKVQQRRRVIRALTF